MVQISKCFLPCPNSSVKEWAASRMWSREAACGYSFTLESMAAPEVVSRREITRARRRQRRRLSVVGVAGEIFITAGFLVFLFLGWQLWLNDIIVGDEQN